MLNKLLYIVSFKKEDFICHHLLALDNSKILNEAD
jgi:hypothetical protein